jgi:hypothetical protein
MMYIQELAHIEQILVKFRVLSGVKVPNTSVPDNNLINRLCEYNNLDDLKHVSNLMIFPMMNK